jgi:hypothetical protein
MRTGNSGAVRRWRKVPEECRYDCEMRSIPALRCSTMGACDGGRPPPAASISLAYHGKSS